MPALAAITINDGKATPVAHTFTPAENKDGRAIFEDRSISTTYIGAWRLVIALRRPVGPAKMATRNIRVNVRVDTPTLEVLSGNDAGYTPAPTVAYRTVANAEFTLPERATKADRKDMRVLMANALLSTAAASAIDDIESFW